MWLSDGGLKQDPDAFQGGFNEIYHQKTEQKNLTNGEGRQGIDEKQSKAKNMYCDLTKKNNNYGYG